MAYKQNVPLDYMDLQTLWNDRRDPHANPMASPPRREEARGGTGSLGSMVESIYRPGPFDTEATGGVSNKRLYTGGK